MGRGPLAGPVVAAAVILHPDRPIAGLADSKTLSARRRDILAGQIQARALACAVGRAEVEEIDRLNILQASLLAMARAVDNLGEKPDEAWVDGLHVPQLRCRARAVVGGDASVAAISAASILAKVTRDREMEQMDVLYPQYGFRQHKGYPTSQHLAALREHGPCPLHRRSFTPVQRCIRGLE